MSSVGQGVGGIVGAVVGWYTGGPTGAIYGAQIGLTVGGLLDPPKGPTITGPRLSDLSVQLSTYGAPLARCYGTVPIVGNVFWLENNQLKEVVTKKKSGGKGGPTSTTKTYSYYATFAVALADTTHTGPIAGIRRIWIGSILWYNAGSDDLETIIASNQAAEGFRFYNGSRNQQPDSRMQADIGVDDCPAYRDTAYIAFYDLPLEKWSNSLQAAQIKVELSTDVDRSANLLFSETIQCEDFSQFQHLTPEYALFFDPQWDNTYPPEAPLYTWEFDTQRSRLLSTGDVTVGGLGANPCRAISDVRGNCITFDSLEAAGFEGSSDLRIVVKSEIIYCLDDDADPMRIWRREDQVWAHVSVSNGCAITADDDGSVYLLKSGGTVEVYDDALSLADTLDISTTLSGISLNGTNTHLHFDSGILWFYSEDVHRVLGFNPADGALLFGPAQLPPGPEGNSHTAFAISGHIAVRGYAADGVACLERFDLSRISTELVALSDIVASEIRLSALVSDVDIDVSQLTDTVRGYRVAGGSIRSALEPLQGSHPFDIIPSGYKIKAVPRGGSSIATIDTGELGAVFGPGMADIVLDGPVREMDTQLPRKLVIKHLDPARDYDINEQSAERQATDSIDIETRELPEVMTPDEAAGVAQTLLYLRWLEREDYAFSLPPTYSDIEPADVVTVESDDISIPLRLTEIAYGADGVIQCKAKPNAPAIYAPNAVGGQGAVSDGEIQFPGEAIFDLLDIPLIRNDDDEPCFAAAMAGTTASWAGGVLYRSSDNEQTWSDVQAWSLPATMGFAREPLAQNDGYVIDRAGELTIELYAGELESVSEAQMMTGMNWAAYGADGRWELLRFVNADLQPDGSYVITNMLRGLRGSEWATGLHQYGDRFVLLDDPDVMVIGADISSLNVTRNWRGVSAGASVEDADTIDFAYQGANLKPLSPVQITGSKPSVDWLFSWTPRTRLQGTLWKTGNELPIGEASERYDVDVLDGDDVVRTLSTTTNQVTYTAAQELEDFGEPQSAIDIRVYQLSEMVGRGFAGSAHVLSGTIISDLLLHFDGTNGSTTITDSSLPAKTITVGGGAQLSTAQVKFGTASVLFNGTNSYLSVPDHADFDFGSGDFTIDMWVRRSAASAVLITKRSNFASYAPFDVGIDASGYPYVECSTSGAAWASVFISSIQLSTSAFQHLEIVRSGNTLMLFVDGALGGSAALTGTLMTNSSPVYIGGVPGAGGWLSGYVDELRIAKGVAAHTSAFTPPSGPYSL